MFDLFMETKTLFHGYRIFHKRFKFGKISDAL